MKKRIGTSILVFVLILALLAATAVAAHLFTRTPKVDAIQEARQALMENYGLTPPTLGLFLTQAEGEKGDWVVTFTVHAAEMFDTERIGSYAVTLWDGKAAEITWTHDDVDPSEWKDAGLEAPVWGQSQMLEALALQEEMNIARMAAAQEREAREREAAAAESSDLAAGQEAQAIEAASQALMETYGFNRETLGLFTASVNHPSETHGEGYITVIYEPDYANVQPSLQGKMGRYYVTLDAQSGGVAQVAWSDDSAWDGGTYTQSNWGTAPAYHASLLPWMIELQETLASISAPYGPESAWGDGLDFIDAGAFDQAFRDVGFPADGVHHREAPGPDEIPYEEAAEIAKAALVQDTGIAEDQLTVECLSAERVPDHDGNPRYNFMYTVYMDGFGAVYSVHMNARTGEIENIEVVTGGNG